MNPSQAVRPDTTCAHGNVIACNKKAMGRIVARNLACDFKLPLQQNLTQHKR
jgi:hypothetical protein